LLPLAQRRTKPWGHEVHFRLRVAFPAVTEFGPKLNIMSPWRRGAKRPKVP
jgi:hypothetical protein